MSSVKSLAESQNKILASIERMAAMFEAKAPAGITRGYIQTFLEEVERQFELFKANHTTITEMISEASVVETDIPYCQGDLYFEGYEKFIDFKSKLMDARLNFPNPSSPQLHSSTFTETTIRSDTMSGGARLPKIDLPKFAGDYLEWIPFRDIFLSLVHNNTTLTNTQKYFYLKASCAETPLTIVNEFPAADASYALAWAALENRFHNTRKLVEQVLKRLWSLDHTRGTVESVKQLHDGTRNCLSLLKSLKVDIMNWDPILIFLTNQKLDAQLKKEWEQSLPKSNELPKMAEMLAFLENTFRTLEYLQDDTPQPSSKSYQTRKADKHLPKRSFHVNTLAAERNCPCCNKHHLLYKCFKFASFNSNQKKDLIAQKKLCRNCLNYGHMSHECKYASRCQVCNGTHHTIVHNEYGKANSSGLTHYTIEMAQPQSNASVNTTSDATHHGHQVLLATANVKVFSNNTSYTLKALLDQGAQASFITEHAVQLLKIPAVPSHVQITGVGGDKPISVKKAVKLPIYSSYSTEYHAICNLFILPKISSYRPEVNSNQRIAIDSKWKLADPQFSNSGDIDLLLGADIYSEIILPGLQKLENGLLLQETVFGWVVSGPVKTSPKFNNLTINYCLLETQLKRFWEQEEIMEERPTSLEDQLCEQFFLNTHSRGSDGKYTVHLPFRKLICQQKLPDFKDTEYTALRRLKGIESTFKSRTEFAYHYTQFMAEYEHLGHMEKIGTYPDHLPAQSFFLPHHGVLRQSSTTTKLRVVFDGSSRRPPQSSLNDELLPGPALQNDLSSIVLRWRRFKIAFTADLEKMFRQIKVCEDHQSYQCILWRDPVTKAINIYKLTTVTYGTTCAPYLAIRVLQQLAEDEKDNFPLACSVLNTDTYVDDVVSGADSLAEVITLQQQLCNLLHSGGFNLRKWNSNSNNFLNTIATELRGNLSEFNLQTEFMAKTLGLSWNTVSDAFHFNLNYSFSSKFTKSSLLSDASKVFDPMGWLAPSTIIAKILFQNLWLTGIDWEDPLPRNVADDWLKYRSSLKYLEEIRIPRWLGTTKSTRVQLHGFSDASLKAFAAVIYARTITENGSIQVAILQSKTKVAPIKTLTIPRLELCAANLLAKLMEKVKISSGLQVEQVTYWTDSLTVLSWINGPASKWAVYVSNRVGSIQRLSNIEDWRYVPSQDNAADCASRGIMPHELNACKIWWEGPVWLAKSPEYWPQCTNKPTTSLEIRKTYLTAETISFAEEDYSWLVSRYSSLGKLLRVTAFLLRFINKSRKLIPYETGYLKTHEIQNARIRILKRRQALCFSSEINLLATSKELPPRSKLQHLAPFLDQDGLIRVGGRLAKADLPYSTKHPIVLTKNDHLSYLILSEAHIKTLHGGVQMILSYVSKSYWILSARNIAKQVVRRCVTCFRYTATSGQQLMGELPAPRVNITRAFKHSGLDYAGPINLKISHLRNAPLTKGYVCLFICMCTKAIHLEAVTSLTTEAFLAAFRRFVSRRGYCSDIFSDCGTNFIGASKELQIMFHRHRASLPEYLVETLANEGTKWHFIPPASPHFGGLWEAGVKSTKYHLRRILKDRNLTYEELSTLLTQIECCLNSRPLSPLRSDPSDCSALTPAHFLIGEPLSCLPDDDLLSHNIERLSRWKKIEKLKQHFWKRWSNEYLCRLQARPKWKQTRNNIKCGDIVILRHEQTSPGQWPLARIENIHPGQDGLVRVVTLWCNGKYIKRPISKISPLPSDESGTKDEVK